MERVGVAAVEDDGIYFAVASVDKEVISWESEPQPPAARPQEGYSKNFVERTIRNHLGKMVKDQAIERIAISMFGLIDVKEYTLLEVPRFDWTGKRGTAGPQAGANTRRRAEKPLIHFPGLFPGLRVYVGHDSSTAAMGEWLERKRLSETGSTHDHFDPQLFVRIRVGTGVGVGVVNNDGSAQTGGSHPEAGHLAVLRPANEPPGTCRAHSKKGKEWDCIEGLASEEAILRRWKARKRERCLTDIDSEDEVWESVAGNLAQLCVAITALIAPSARAVSKPSVNQPRIGARRATGRYLTKPDIAAAIAKRPVSAELTI